MTSSWQTKLAALLHDPPDKCLAIHDHEESARRFQVGAGLVEPDMFEQHVVKAADHFAAAADRFAFAKGKCATIFRASESGKVIHPLSSTPYELPVGKLLNQAGLVHDILQGAIGGIDTDDPHKAFFLYWRRWLENAATAGQDFAPYLALLPADTRIPDHSIWIHNSATSALAGCAVNGALRPALLLFQLGPVQDFIAQARSTRDLWSGSYLLSWLMGHAMKAVSDAVGPDAMIFPNLRGNGIFDALHRESMYAVTFNSGDKKQSLWERILHEKNDAVRSGMTAAASPAACWLTTPTLPNRFLALVPADRAKNLAQAAEKALRDELKQIGDAVWAWIAQEAQVAGCSGLAQWRSRWDAQIEAFPQITWAVQPWLKREECLQRFAKLPVNTPQAPTKKTQGAQQTPLGQLNAVLALAEQWLPKDDRDERYYTDKKLKDRLDNPGILWSAHYALVDAKLAARRNTRDFAAWNDPCPTSSIKDSLSGKEEVIGDEKFWNYLREHYGKDNGNLFATAGHSYGAMNLIKRLWCRDNIVPYLRDALGLHPDDFQCALKFDSVEGIADGNQRHGKYVAVLAMDGDEMGKWVSGMNTPAFLDQLSEPARRYLEPLLRDHDCAELRRLLTPSYHLQFSEALANFATWIARPVVEAHDGQLIYAGGDDVLAMLPADRALACAKALRELFRGKCPEDPGKYPLHVKQDGMVHGAAGYPLQMPGERAEVSIGIAIGHFQAPLQMLVREAQAAEHRAKHHYGRAAVAFSLYKRSGEIIQWGCKWTSAALPLMTRLEQLSARDDKNGNGSAAGQLSERFPYALAALLAPYQLDKVKDKDKDLTIDRDTLCEIVMKEVDHVLSRQGADLRPEDKMALRQDMNDWLDECAETKPVQAADQKPGSAASADDSSQHLGDFIQPFMTETFINRGTRGDE